ncbi:tyrosine-type recombinase/integrase [Micromonospora sp. KC606]|uniref:tyrosine-type recombinase/integrase n=1 Tax=Micromonospora sp. KC606 TaxID=2530379 RepID=UPI001FB752C8|nr:tyrosine-type recombinase/integrase [Micromonospora sp. KC606]
MPDEVIRGGISEEGRGSGQRPEVFSSCSPQAWPAGPADAGRRSPAGRGRAGAARFAGRLDKVIGWSAAIGKLGVPGLHFHDLRHTGNTIAARTGASTRELMARMGHDSSQAAIIYQHATSEADRAIAQAVSDAVKAERKKAKKPAASTSVKANGKGKKTGKKRG